MRVVNSIDNPQFTMDNSPQTPHLVRVPKLSTSTIVDTRIFFIFYLNIFRITEFSSGFLKFVQVYLHSSGFGSLLCPHFYEENFLLLYCSIIPELLSS
jgi:hypothetical protein